MIQHTMIVTCDQCKDEERSRDGERVGEFMRRLRAEGWRAWLAGDEHYCSSECEAFQKTPSSEDSPS